MHKNLKGFFFRNKIKRRFCLIKNSICYKDEAGLMIAIAISGYFFDLWEDKIF